MLDAGGNVTDSSLVGRRSASCSTPAELRRALRGPVFVDRGPLPGLREESRLLAVPVDRAGAGQVVVVGTSTEARNESLTDLAQLLLVGGPFALILASLAAYGVAAAALKPVEAMRSRAAEISAAEPDQRLPVPPTDDEVARLGKTLNEMLERLGEALEHERAFVADASHELRTPLAILRTELELALAAGRSPEELRAALASAAEETDRLTQLSEDLLTIAQTERGELPLRLARLDLREILEGVGRRFSRRAEEGGREIEVAAPPALVLGADRLRLDQAVGSMVDNALRYGAGTIELSAGAGERVGRDPRARPGRRDSPRISSAVPSSASAAPRRATATAAAASAWRSSRPSPMRTAARRRQPTASGGGADVWLTLPLRPATAPSQDALGSRPDSIASR